MGLKAKRWWLREQKGRVLAIIKSGIRQPLEAKIHRLGDLSFVLVNFRIDIYRFCVFASSIVMELW